ncbi:FAD-linked sulfhydryl oxidase ALR-like [Styela clava]|uniref:FAD-linked sulfhydryl oxidase ALR-like n=1 Tax=Styela clava TaxID=7725 RepID=UPI00193A734B|nr:FAD-linked sulfhydryl oxidase ALR-like [Styela clava]
MANPKRGSHLFGEENLSHYRDRGEKHCRACESFQTWRNFREKGKPGEDKNKEQNSPTSSDECPLDREELGRNSWSFLHTMAAYYPKKPTDEQKKSMTQFMDIFAQFYPCKDCAKDLRKSLKNSRPAVQDRYTFSNWMCQIHNEVNKKLGKSEFDCSLVLERWRTGWKDGSCD